MLQVGLSYVCATAERFFAVSAVLSSCVSALSAPPSARLLKHIIRCYLRLSDNTRAREALLNCLPRQFLDVNFTSCLKDDDQTKQCAPQCSIGPACLARLSNRTSCCLAMRMSTPSEGVSCGDTGRLSCAIDTSWAFLKHSSCPQVACAAADQYGP